MARKESDFKHDGIAAGLSYAYKKGSDISTAAEVIAFRMEQQRLQIYMWLQLRLTR